MSDRETTECSVILMEEIETLLWLQHVCTKKRSEKSLHICQETSTYFCLWTKKSNVGTYRLKKAVKQWYPCPGVNANINTEDNCFNSSQKGWNVCAITWGHVPPGLTVSRLLRWRWSSAPVMWGLRHWRELYLLFPFFVPLECGGAPCLLSLVLQELCSSLFLFEHVELVV